MNVAFIPVRGGSKSIPLKNIKNLAGYPLIYWTLQAANDCDYIDKIFVATDSEVIKNTVIELMKSVNQLDAMKIEVIDRSASVSTDEASTESVMLEFSNRYEFDNVVLIQATSPLLSCIDLNNGFNLFTKEKYDSVLSVVRQKRFIWRKKSDGSAEPSNYDYMMRPRRQEFDGYNVENGAFYITSKEALQESKNRISGQIGMVEMSEETYIELDEKHDWDYVEQILKNRKPILSDLSKIKIVLSDCDGCLTDSGMYYSEAGDELKKFNTRDGVAFAAMKKCGVLTGVVTGENRELNRRRIEKMSLDYYFPGCNNKLKIVSELLNSIGLSFENLAYIGDDINDLELMKHAGISVTPADGVDKIKSVANIVTSTKGGQGVIRDFYDNYLSSEIQPNEVK